MERVQPAIGLLVMIGLLVAFSANRRAIRWRIVAWGLALQVLFAVFVLKVPAGYSLFRGVNTGFLAIIDATEAGADFLFGPLGTSARLEVGDVDEDGVFHAVAGRFADTPKMFAFRILPTIVFFSALMAVGYYLGIMQLLVRGVARVMSVTMKTSGAETLSAAANIFVGQTEAPLMVRPYVNRMTNSELMAVMSGGFATVAGGVMAAFVGLLEGKIDNIGAHLMTASVMSAPASLMMAKILLPETEASQTLGDSGAPGLSLPRTDANVVDAAARGTTEGLRLAANVGAMLLVFIALVALVNILLSAAGEHLLGLDTALTLERIFGWAFAPVAWLLGVPWADCGAVGQLLGTKTFVNEFVAYIDLASMGEAGGRDLSPRARLIASYALCGFANISSIGIQIGGIGAMAPERRGDLARLGLRAMIVGSLAAFSTACIVAIMT